MTKADATWCQDFLAAHNKYRALHQAGPVKYNEKLNKLAQAWADSLASRDTFQHSDCQFEDGRVGENIAMKMSSSKTDFEGHEFVDQWYSEIERYDFQKHGGPSTGHFTQVVWKGSEEIGVGKGVTKSGKVLVVGNYFPAGNMMGDNATNVFPTVDGTFQLPEKDKPKAKNKKPAGSSEVPVGTNGHRNTAPSNGGMENRTAPSDGDINDYKSLRKETLKRRTPDGKVETIVREIYTMPDGSKQTKEKREIKDGQGPLLKGVEKKKVPSAVTSHDDEGAVCDDVTDDEGSKKGVDSEELKKFRAEVVKAHNDHRKRHGAPLIKRNRQLDKVAQQWASHLAETGDFTHSKNEYKGHRLGENIANKWSSAGADYNGQEVTDQWYKEEPQYDYKGDSKSLNAGHFTQVVWGGSKEVGIGKAKTSNGKCIVVCNYYPAGNIIGHFKENVFEPKK